MSHFATDQIAGMTDAELNLRLAVLVGEIEIELTDDGDLWGYWNDLPLWYRRIRRLIKGDPPGPYAPGVYCGAYTTDAGWNAWAVARAGVLITSDSTLRQRAESAFAHLDALA